MLLRVQDYDLAATLDSGQAFRWQERPGGWHGVIGEHWVRLTQMPEGIRAEVAAPVKNWDWLRDYLQTEVDLAAVLKTFPDDAPMRAAVAACRGLRVLRQDPWECLASFILSSTKQIVQIRQIISLLCERFGEPVAVPAGCAWRLRVSRTGKNRGPGRSRTARLQDGFSRAASARRRPANRRWQAGAGPVAPITALRRRGPN